jgi:hypothetical protein
MKKRNSYYDVICGEISVFTRKSLAHGDSRAWANKKDKAYKKIVPRGKVFDRLHKQEWNAVVKMVNNLSTKWKKIET